MSLTSTTHLNLGQLKEATHILLTTHNPPKDYSTYLRLLQTCILMNALSQGKKLHSFIAHRRFAFAIHTTFHNKLIYMYGKCGSLVDARKVFDYMKKRDCFSWNTIIAAYRRHGFPQEAVTLFHRMQKTGLQPDQFTLASVLPACAKMGALEQGMDIHKSIKDRRILSDVVVATALVDMYAKCGSIEKACELFDTMPERNVFTWTAMIAGFAQNGFVEKARDLFNKMPQRNEVSWSAMIAGYAQNGFVEKARELFDKMPQRNVVSWNAMIAGYAQNGFVEKACELFVRMPQRNIVSWSAMIAGYAQNGFIEKARQLFDRMPQRNVVLWNAMIAGYAQNGLDEKALETFNQMQVAGVKPDSTTFASILPVCAKMAALKQGMDIHRSIKDREILSDVVVATALVDMYAKCGSIHKARELFDRMPQRNVFSWTAMIVGYAKNGSIRKARELFDKMPQRNVVSWNAMIAGYAQNGFAEKASETFKQMQVAGVKPDSTTFASILPACAKMGALEQGMDIHQNIKNSGNMSDVVANALVDMYAKCGSMEKARELFDRMLERDVFLWTTMIAGYAQNGFVERALETFKQMQLAGVKPNSTTFSCVLCACSHAGLVDEGCTYFNHMSNPYCITPTFDHYVCMVDLLARAGYLEDTLNFIIKMPVKPAVVVWMCFLNACRSHMNIGLGVFTATLLFDLDPKNAATYVLLSNIYAEVGRWGEVQMVRRLMKDRGIKKIPGCSWIEGQNMVHAFCVGDSSHPHTHKIYEKLEKLA